MDGFERRMRTGARALALGCLVALMTACESYLALGAACELASDCPDPLVCLAGRCRNACVELRDCPYPLECVALGASTFGCRVGEDAACRGAEDCAPPLACLGGACQQGCGNAAECAPGLVCDGDQCAQPSPLTGVGACDPTAANTGCAAGTRCALADGAFSCVENSGSGTPDGLGEACSRSCGEGLACAGGRCVRVCRQPAGGCSGADCDDTSCGEDLYCDDDSIGSPDGAPLPELPAALGYCSERCDPYADEANDGCPDGTACSITNPRGTFFFWCRPLRSSGLLAPYADCDPPADLYACPHGTSCEIGEGGVTPEVRLCREFCRPGSTDECADGRPCVTIDPLDIGICADP